MRKFLVVGLGLGLAALPGLANAEEDQNYTLTIEGKNYDTAPGQTVHAKLKSGAEIDIALERKAFSTFSKDGFSFEYPSNLSLTQSEIDKNITQYLVTTALGSFTIVQRYRDLNTSKLTDFMADTLTRDDKNLGAVIEKSPATRKLSTGTEIKGVKTVVKKNGDEAIYEVYAANIGDGGLIAVSHIDQDNAAKDQPGIDRFWSSLKID